MRVKKSICTVALLFCSSFCLAQGNLLSQMIVPYRVNPEELLEVNGSYYIMSSVIKDTAFYPWMPYLKPSVYSLHKFSISGNTPVASAWMYGDTLQADSVVEQTGKFVVDGDRIHIVYVKRIMVDTSLLPQWKRFAWGLYYKQLDTNLITVVAEKRLKLADNNSPFAGIYLQAVCALNNKLLIAFIQTDTLIPYSNISKYILLDKNGNVEKEDTLGEAVPKPQLYHRVENITAFSADKYLISGVNLFSMTNGGKMFYIADTALNLIDTFLIKPNFVYNPPDNWGYFTTFPILVPLPTGSIIGGGNYYHEPSAQFHTALFKCLPTNRYKIDTLVTFKNIDALDDAHWAATISNMVYNKTDNRIYFANQTHSYPPAGMCYPTVSGNYVQVICADTNLTVKWKKYIKLDTNACSRVTYVASCDGRPGVLIAGRSYNITNKLNDSLTIDFLYHLDSAIVASVDPLSSVITDRIVVSPNPARNIITVKDIEGRLSEVAVFDFTGKKLFYQRINKTEKATVDISSFAQGIYFIRATTSDGEAYGKKVLKN